MAETNSKKVRITYIRSAIGFSVQHKKTIKALGFSRLNQTVEHSDSPSLRGMLYQVSQLVRIEESV
jgi:large subunit ribosomal protein L30